MTDEEVELLLKAGKIAAKAREAGAKAVRAGAKVLDVCDAAEKEIFQAGAMPSFPCNVSVNYEAAHYTPLIGDQKTIPEGAVVKVDVGAHIDGYVTDTAVTVSLDDRFSKLLEATRDSLKAAISTFRAGRDLGEVGRVIERTLKVAGFKPIRNLGGHLIRRYELHAGAFVPNVFERGLGPIRPGETYAIEPFGTDGEGSVREGKEVTIFSFRGVRNKVLTEEERFLIEVIEQRFRTLPFTERWLVDVMEVEKLRATIKSLWKKGVLNGYPVLLETRMGTVAQFEHTVLVQQNGVIVVTELSP
ncbi:type II methionyl aminopeptidase [Sulfodiicoccus acidiphilus]|uniref:Methionine aminopeptidase n=1 Tax=Sulfodiicoccus acidiphilus TaxID=1670455 RepID=A0A348B0I1_9CREN|nr:type II methionyl aminopeptidase [Sulfodiicoccus acidiphilus]BBD71683.1 type II methionyl aminopeptidase [Sulfodiicoccus acidiphilus]GGT86628.1 type II methionyl aminopeptidase [Sulfodiicoccus acidiphilus]